MEELQESPTSCIASTSDRRRKLIALVPFVIVVPTLTLAAVLLFARPLPRNPNDVVFGIVGAILAFDLPVCVWVLIQWMATGQPPDLSLSPLILSREERAFHRALRERPKLDDGQFFDAFYATSSIPRHFPAQLRDSLEKAFGLDFGALHPTDNLILADSEIDWADVIDRVNREFDIVLPRNMIDRPDGTFDSLLRSVVQVANRHAGS